MKLSIVVPFYNAEDHLERCLTSLTNQNLSKSDCEIILINDGSTDNGITIAEQFRNKHINIYVHCQKNKGLGASRNIGIQLAKGDYIYFIDADDYLAFNTLSIPLEYLEKNNLDILGFSTLITDKLDLFSYQQEPIENIEVITGNDFLVKHKNNRLEAWWYILKREFLLETNLKFEEGKFMEDAVFSIKIFLEANRIMFLPITIHRYVKSPHSIMNNEDQKHLKKVVADYISLAYRFNTLINEISKKEIKNTDAIIKNIKFKSTVSIYFMFFKLIRLNISIPKIYKILRDLEKINVYPLTNFIGEVYNHPKIKVTAYVFNHKYLFFLCLYPLRIMHSLKLIKLY
ncbi:glycosyltransferase [Hwangdonia lutea]|uniref:Glycosyltransferase n=1 Tax=Hwangdonia lutea TaxID=3075823 RepID=A0AA97ENQ7_9FLAO|nr:glycosyltransferase [Hwangdonia sp. SCSIO 19198]WOD43420.1 glycosyltransferase [Hwangdonia sp. SCSIO 19198]